jgi:hypothetical protein
VTAVRRAALGAPATPHSSVGVLECRSEHNPQFEAQDRLMQ